MLCLKAHAKINWTLDILGTRPDGYHLMDMLMQSVDMHDTLWLEEADTLLDKVFGGSAELLFASVLSGRKLKKEELERLRALVEAQEG